jgi:hypothetical protein
VISTLLMYFSFSSLVYGLADETAADPNRTAAFGFGLAAVPFVLVTLAFGTRHPRASRAVLASLGLWLGVSLVLGLLSVGLGISMGFGVAGIFCVRHEPEHSYVIRAWAVVAALIYTVILAVINAPLGLFAAGTVPLIAVGLADYYSEKRAGSSKTS